MGATDFSSEPTGSLQRCQDEEAIMRLAGTGGLGCDGMPGPVKTIICFIAATFTLSISYNVAFITGLAGGLMASPLIYSGFWWSSVSFSLSNRSLFLGWNLMLALERACTLTVAVQLQHQSWLAEDTVWSEM